MKRLTLFLLAGAALMGACGHPGVQGQAPSPVPPLPYRLTLEMTSRIPDPYYVLVGPGESYRRFPFNAWAEKALHQRLAARSGAPSQPPVKVAVQLLELHPAYSEIGEGPVLTSPIYAGMRARGFLGGDDFDGDGKAIPSEIHKAVRLTGTLEVWRDGRLMARRDLTAAVEEVVYWHDHDAWSYDYGDLLKAVIAKLSAEVDANLVEMLGGGSGS